MALDAARIIALLDLIPHPEGGHYREMFRDVSGDDRGARAHSTAIYYLLAEGEASHWHRVDATEVWHWYAGDALDLRVWTPGEPVSTIRLGANLEAGERPQAIVPTGTWQAAATTGGFTLVGCTVAPGFEFSGFEMAPPGWSPPP